MKLTKKGVSALALPLIAVSSMLGAAEKNDACEPTQPATCYPDSCSCTPCLGPDNYAVNAPVYPKTCGGDVIITVSGFYWNAHQDGMEYAIENNVTIPSELDNLGQDNVASNLVNACFETPNYKWDFGFKVGLGYAGCHDGWDIGVEWTWYKGKSSGSISADADDNSVLIPLWSGYQPAQSGPLYARNIEEDWRLELNLIDIELGREFWTSKYMSLRPHVGLRVAYINQDFGMKIRGGSWGVNNITGDGGQMTPYNGEVDLDNDYKGVGIRAGLDSTWHLGCGFGIYGNFAASIVYGRFSVDHDEDIHAANGQFGKMNVLETNNSFRASRAMLDLDLGLQWSTMFCDCSYGFTVMLGWENHLFFNQNQMWRIHRTGGQAVLETDLPNNNGENVYQQRRGDLDTQGWTLTFKFDF